VQSIIVILILKITNMLKTKYFIECMLIASVLLSCTKNESFDIKGDPAVIFFTNNLSPGNSPQNAINYSLVNIPDPAGDGLLNLSSTIPGTIKFPVFATRPVNQDVIIGAELDNSLIEAYNAAHNTNYSEFPADMFNTDGLIAHVLKGASSSADSITLISNPTILNTLTKTAYMAPIRLTSVSEPVVGKISSNSTTQVSYIVVTVEQRKIKYLALAAEAQGSLQTPRTSWVTTLSPLPLATVGSVIDGSTATYSRWSASPGQIDVDMQTSKNVTGVRLYTSNSSTYIPTQIYIYLSTNGINYDLIGSPLKANLTYASSYNYILFYEAIQARYIRLVIYYSTSTSSSNRRLAEFDVYAN
jgi:hypothetical protein